MQRIALMGTSADPPTCGHQALIEGLLAHYPQVAVWASDNPKKEHAAPLLLRIALLQALVDDIANPRLHQIQALSHPFTIRSLARAGEHWPDADLVFVVGSDLAAQIPLWKQPETWLQRCRLAIAPRRGWPLERATVQALELLGARIDHLDLELPASASSELRRSPHPDQVPQAVWPLLLKHNLYGLSPSSG